MNNLNPETIDLIRENQDLLNRRLKSWIETELHPTVPDLSTFISHGNKVLEKLKKDPEPYRFSITEKYESWIENDWKDGNNRKIKNWKSKLSRTIPYLRAIYPDRKFNDTGKAAASKKLVFAGNRPSETQVVQETLFSVVK